MFVIAKRNIRRHNDCCCCWEVICNRIIFDYDDDGFKTSIESDSFIGGCPLCHAGRYGTNPRYNNVVGLGITTELETKTIEEGNYVLIQTIIIINGDLDPIRYLIENENTDDVNQTDNDRYITLIKASEYGHLEIVPYWIEHHNNTDVNRHRKYKMGSTAGLIRAVIRNDDHLTLVAFFAENCDNQDKHRFSKEQSDPHNECIFLSID